LGGAPHRPLGRLVLALGQLLLGLLHLALGLLHRQAGVLVGPRLATPHLPCRLLGLVGGPVQCLGRGLVVLLLLALGVLPLLALGPLHALPGLVAGAGRLLRRLLGTGDPLHFLGHAVQVLYQVSGLVLQLLLPGLLLGPLGIRFLGQRF